MSANEEEPSIKCFDELFNAVISNSITSLHVLIFTLKGSSILAPDFVYNLLNKAHPTKKVSILQRAIEAYPKTSLLVIKELLLYGAGTELPVNPGGEKGNILATPLWIAVEKKHPAELIKLLLSFKADPFFRSYCHPFAEDKKSFSSKENRKNGYTLLHLVAKVDNDVEILKALIEATSGILLNDQNNNLRETPLMLAVKQKNIKFVEFLIEFDEIDLNLKDLNGLTAYESAAKDHLVVICKLFGHFGYSEDLCYYLEIIERIKINNHTSWRNFRDSRELRDFSESDGLLPIEGYWEWMDSDWLPVHGQDDLLCRLRRKVLIKEPLYLKEAIESIKTSPQTSLNLLLQGLQHEKDSVHKSKAANYFQRLLKWVDECGSDPSAAIGLLDNLSRSDLRIFSGSNSRDIMQQNTTSPSQLNNLKIASDLMTFDSDSDDSLLYCPACSHKFIQDRESHLASCLVKKQQQVVIGRRYTSTKTDTNMVKGECPICYEDLVKGRVAVMDCLCKFHEKCIEEWFKRGKQCPFHSE